MNSTTIGTMVEMAHDELYEWFIRESNFQVTDETRPALADLRLREGAIMDLLARRVGAVASGSRVYCDGTREYAALTYEPRQTATEYSRTMLERVICHAAYMKIPRCVSMEIGPVVRVTRRRENGQRMVVEKFTAVVVRLRSPVTADRFVVVRAELNQSASPDGAPR